MGSEFPIRWANFSININCILAFYVRALITTKKFYKTGASSDSRSKSDSSESSESELDEGSKHRRRHGEIFSVTLLQKTVGPINIR
jgi:hypothetical protein